MVVHEHWEWGDRCRAFVHDAWALRPSGQGKEGGAPGVLRSPWLDGVLVATDGGGGTEDLNGWHRALVHDARALTPG